MAIDIKAERERAGLSQARLAELAGVAQSNLSALESGKRPLSARMASRLLHHLRRPSQALAEHRTATLATIAQFGANNPRVLGLWLTVPTPRDRTLICWLPYRRKMPGDSSAYSALWPICSASRSISSATTG